MQVFNSFQEMAVGTGALDAQSQMGVFNDHDAKPPISIVRKVADVAGAANDWMGRNIGLAVPSGREYRDGFDKTTGVPARAVGRVAKAVGRDAYAGAQGGFDDGKRFGREWGDYVGGGLGADVGGAIGGVLGGAVGAIITPFGGAMDRGIDRHKPKASDDISE